MTETAAVQLAGLCTLCVLLTPFHPTFWCRVITVPVFQMRQCRPRERNRAGVAQLQRAGPSAQRLAVADSSLQTPRSHSHGTCTWRPQQPCRPGGRATGQLWGGRTQSGSGCVAGDPPRRELQMVWRCPRVQCSQGPRAWAEWEELCP